MIDFNLKDYLTDRLQPGRYTVLIKDATLKDNKNNDGKHLSLKLEVVGSFKKGFSLYDNLCIYNAKDVVQEIARKRLAQLFKVLNMLDDKDCNKLIGHTVDAEVTEYNDSNVVKGYFEAMNKNQYDAITEAPAAFNDDIPF